MRERFDDGTAIELVVFKNNIIWETRRNQKWGRIYIHKGGLKKYPSPKCHAFKITQKELKKIKSIEEIINVCLLCDNPILKDEEIEVYFDDYLYGYYCGKCSDRMKEMKTVFTKSLEKLVKKKI